MLLTHPDLPKKTFQFTFPARGTTRDAEIKAEDAEISIHVPREGNDPVFRISSDFPRNISIHVPREGNDLTICFLETGKEISIHVPREGNDLEDSRRLKRDYKFQSTFPARGTT